MKKKVKIKDRNFSHVDYSSDFQESEFIVWDRDISDLNNDLCFVTDSFLQSDVINENHIGWLLEPRGTAKNNYEYIENNFEKFKFVLTYDRELLSKNKKFVFYPHGGCWIRPGEEKIYNKTKLLSMISSTKHGGAEGYLIRQRIRESMNTYFDSFGRGHNEISFKVDALKDYMFSITVENSKFDYYFSEKLIDCFMTGTIPIYWGCPSIGDFFDINGIITFESLEELSEIIKNINSELYFSKKESIEKNFETAKNFVLSEDWIYKNTKILI